MREVRKKEKMNEKNFLSFKEACQYLDVSASFLYKLTSKKGIRYSKPNNGKIYFKKSDLDDWMMKNLQESKADVENKLINFLNPKKNGKNKY